MEEKDVKNRQKEALAIKLKEEIGSKPFSDLMSVTLNGKSSSQCAALILDALQACGVDLKAVHAFGSLSLAGIPLVVLCVEEAKKRGVQADGFLMDFVYPSIKGCSVKGKKVVLLDAWISDLGYIQTSSVVTLTKMKELELDWSIVKAEGASILAIASLLAGSEKQEPPSSLRLKDMNSGEVQEVPFAFAFSRSDLEK